jgi:hypothetical protein
MPEENIHGTTLEECIAAGGARLPKSRQRGLKVCVEDYLRRVFTYDFDNGKKMPQYRERELIAEIRGYAKAQEHLREIIAMGGTEAIAELAEIRDERQMRPKMFGNMRTWVG